MDWGQELIISSQLRVFELDFKDGKELCHGFSFNLWFMPTVPEPDKPKILYPGDQGFTDPLRRVGVMVTMNRNHRTLDLVSEL